jgi:phage portal protein BeeE
MTINDRYAFQQKSMPGDQEMFVPLNSFGPGQYTLSAPPAELLKLYGAFIYGHRSDRNLITLYHSIPEIYAPIDAIARRVIAANWQLRSIATDEVVQNNKFWNALVEQVNPLQTFIEWLYEAVTYKYVIGKNYAYKNVPDTLTVKFANIAALWNLPGDRVTPFYRRGANMFNATKIEEIIEYYQLYDGTNSGEYPTTKILHTKSINLDWQDQRKSGKSPLLAADIALCNLIAVYEARNVIYTKRGALGAIISKKEDASGAVALTPKEKRNIRNDFNEEYGLKGNKDLFPISDVPIDFVRFGMSIQELTPFEEATADMAAIYSVLNVPFDLAPNPKGSTYDNQKGSMRSIYTNTVIPEAQRWATAISRFLGLTDAGLYLFPDFSKIEELQNNKKEEADTDESKSRTNLTLFTTGVITLNQWCVRQGIDKVSNALYDKHVYDMTPEELLIVKEILNIAKPASNGTGNYPGGQAPPKTS